MGNLVPILIFLIIIFASGLKKLLQYLAQQAAAAKEEEGRYEAAPDQIREFLEQISGGQRAQPGRPVVVGERVAPEILGAPVALEPMELELPQPTAPPARQVPRQEPERAELAPPLEPLGQPIPRRKTPRRARPRRRRPAAARRPEPRGKPAPTETIMLTAFKGGKWDLRQAVIWSEILGTPIGLRRRLGHRPHVFSH